jgi:hypothetical protein
VPERGVEVGKGQLITSTQVDFDLVLRLASGSSVGLRHVFRQNP